MKKQKNIKQHKKQKTRSTFEPFSFFSHLGEATSLMGIGMLTLLLLWQLLGLFLVFVYGTGVSLNDFPRFLIEFQ